MELLSTINMYAFLAISVILTIAILARKYKGSGLSGMLGTSAANTVASSTIADRNIGRLIFTLSLLWIISVMLEAIIVSHTL